MIFFLRQYGFVTGCVKQRVNATYGQLILYILLLLLNGHVETNTCRQIIPDKCTLNWVPLDRMEVEYSVLSAR